MAIRVEDELRRSGVVPATTAFINGVPRVGLTRSEIELLSCSKDALKVSRRDIPYVMANKLDGGTTISGTMILSHRAGIKVFATGGLGGVHRDGEVTMDVSADLDELGKTPVAVVCAGPKSILDIARTMEYLETKGVFVGTWGPPGTNIPGFYTRDSGVKSVYNFDEFEQAAHIIQQEELMQLGTGQLFCIPPPEDIALDGSFISGVIEEANREAKELGIMGKELTPFLLSKIAVATNGQSVKTNIEFVLNNVRSAAQIAHKLSTLRTGSDLSATPIQSLTPQCSSSQTDSMVIGSVALDTFCSMEQVILEDSNPAKITSSVGGVGYNVASESLKHDNVSIKFVSIVGEDAYGSKILESIKIPSRSIEYSSLGSAQYISFHDKQGSLIVGAADMGIIETLSPEFAEQQIVETKPKVVLSDANISKDLINHINKLSMRHGFKYIVEPTSVTKAKRLAIDSLTPESPLLLCTPTVIELCSLYDAFEIAGKFELDNWFPVLDRLGIDGSFRTRLENAAMKSSQYRSLVSEGVVQMAVSLLPYIRTLIVKDGANGVYLFTRYGDIRKVNPSSDASLSLQSQGPGREGILFEHYESPEALDSVSNVTGAGDALAGCLLAEITNDVDILNGDLRSEAINKAQRAAIDKIR
jgi:pseudouridine-5'-phosphate glycosidase/pseudouridine kinase